MALSIRAAKRLRTAFAVATLSLAFPLLVIVGMLVGATLGALSVVNGIISAFKDEDVQ